eukprot:CAMPEP_0174699458 /NCGR_PEP_ID=MMETSP1094-20130205/4733_1 /TAXON_ID=156173 /ORGANISM="Chrysochromulina brevifilum, Strain UTEX LB 985" /LENGTH=55 /DNA_ID=CAMNT_0015896797 /DNA_START=126 /DNA_END=289 /DNA_ORIENTATION=-
MTVLSLVASSQMTTLWVMSLLARPPLAKAPPTSTVTASGSIMPLASACTSLGHVA